MAKGFASYARTCSYLQQIFKRVTPAIAALVGSAETKLQNPGACHPACRGLTINALLIQPMQRAMRYEMLLHEVARDSCVHLPAVVCLVVVE